MTLGKVLPQTDGTLRGRGEQLMPDPAPKASPPDCAYAKEEQTAPSPGGGGGAETYALSIALARPITNDVPPIPSQREDPINAGSLGPTYRRSLLRQERV